MSDIGFGRGFSRDVEAILSIIQAGLATGETFIYPHEVRENLRLAGMRLDGRINTPEFPDPFDLPADYEPEWEDGPENVDIMDEEDVSV